MPKFKVGESVLLGGRPAKVIWLSENANEIEAMDEYIVEFEDKHRQFVVSGRLKKESEPVYDREHDGDACYDQAS